jgi:ceramide glucosyltransferase
LEAPLRRVSELRLSVPTVIHHFPEAVRDLVLLAAAAPLAYYVFASVAAVRFFASERKRVLPDFTPPLSLLKPVRGVDFASYENFASFCLQDYPDYEILFAVNAEGDAALPLIRRLIEEFPERRIRVFIGAAQLGANKKVNKLVLLAREAQHEILVITDGDVRVGPHYLREVAAPFAVSSTGAVTSFYRGVAEANLGAELEAVGAASDFFPGVLMARWMEGMTFGLGASIATTKTWLRKIGGLELIANMHSDDYELGHRIAEAGGRVMLSREAVWTMYPAASLGSFWQHQVRWARTVRLCRPLSYVGLIFTHGLPWAILAALAAHTRAAAGAYLLSYLMLRMAMAYVVGVWGVGDEVLRRKLYLVPLRDALNFAVWLGSFASNRIRWGDSEFAMEEGRMVAVGSSPSTEVKPSAPVTR